MWRCLQGTLLSLLGHALGGAFSAVSDSSAFHLVRYAENVRKQAAHQVSEQADTKEAQVRPVAAGLG